MCPYRLIVLVIAAALAGPAACDETRSLDVSVVDPNGRPRPGVVVTPGGLASKLSAITWIGSPDERTTDADGIARFDFPAGLADEGPIVRIWLSAAHPDYVLWSGETRVEPGGPAATPLRVTLAGGTPVTIDLESLDGPIDPAAYVVTVPGAGLRGVVRTRVEQARLVTGPLPAEASKIRVTAGEGETRQMSDWLSWTPDEPLVTALLQAGETLRGELSIDVPRPVRRGVVVAIFTAPGPAGHALLGRHQAVVDPDGTFTLSAVPPYCDVQIAALAEGWASAQSLPEARDRAAQIYDSRVSFRRSPMNTPQLFKSTADGPLTVVMRPTADVSLTVRNADGSPATGATVYVHSSIYYFGWASTGFPSGLGEDRFARKATTDAEGKAVFKNLSSETPLRLQIYLKEPAVGAGGMLIDQTARVTLRPGETAVKTVTLPKTAVR